MITVFFWEVQRFTNLLLLPTAVSLFIVLTLLKHASLLNLFPLPIWISMKFFTSLKTGKSVLIFLYDHSLTAGNFVFNFYLFFLFRISLSLSFIYFFYLFFKYYFIMFYFIFLLIVILYFKLEFFFLKLIYHQQAIFKEFCLWGICGKYSQALSNQKFAQSLISLCIVVCCNTPWIALLLLETLIACSCIW